MEKAGSELYKFLAKHGKGKKFPMNKKGLGGMDQEAVGEEKSKSKPRSETLSAGTADSDADHIRSKTGVEEGPGTKKKKKKKPYMDDCY